MFNESQQVKSEFILGNPNAWLNSLDQKDIKSLAVVWSYYSGKIEGNTYTYAETEALLLDGITSLKRFEDAVMLTNLFNSFVGAIRDIKRGNPFTINEITLCSLHSRLTDQLVNDADRGQFRSRAVRITDTNYFPPRERQEINVALNEVFNGIENYSNPLERAVYAHCNLARIQPFVDGNKRTARIVESILMLESNLVPVYSTKDQDILNYRTAIINFYETKNYRLYAEYFLNKQIERIKEVSVKSELTFEQFRTEKNKKQGLRMKRR